MARATVSSSQRARPGGDGRRDRQRDVQRLRGRRRHRPFEVVARRDATTFGRYRQPVALGGWPTETDLVVAVGVGIDVVVAQHAGGAGRVLAVDRAGFHGERCVHRAREIAAHDVFTRSAHRRLEIHGVGVVAREAAGRRHDAQEDRSIGIELLVCEQRRLQDVREVAHAVTDVVEFGHAPFGTDAPLACFAQHVE